MRTLHTHHHKLVLHHRHLQTLDKICHHQIAAPGLHLPIRTQSIMIHVPTPVDVTPANTPAVRTAPLVENGTTDRRAHRLNVLAIALMTTALRLLALIDRHVTIIIAQSVIVVRALTQPSLNSNSSSHRCRIRQRETRRAASLVVVLVLGMSRSASENRLDVRPAAAAAVAAVVSPEVSQATGHLCREVHHKVRYHRCREMMAGNLNCRHRRNNRGSSGEATRDLG
jgi:hypothetical protein